MNILMYAVNITLSGQNSPAITRSISVLESLSKVFAIMMSDLHSIRDKINANNANSQQKQGK